ncbi:MAG: cytochrome c [Cyclobacteriaceae bacterium]|nr:cytochrome c [Cyclobacteriaceae bacterium]
MKNFTYFILLLIIVFAFCGLTLNNDLSTVRFDVDAFKTSHLVPLKNNAQDADTTKWITPSSVDDLVNPITPDEESIEEGILVYRKHCRSCHGRNGDGKGVQAKELSTPATDFTSPEVFEQSDGSLFWKISEGRNDMEPYKKKILEEDLWYVINFIKTFAQTSEE